MTIMAQLSIPRREWRRVLVLSLFLIGLTTLPYAIARAAEPAQARFNGFLVNPIDGHTYLAKMRQGERGDWLFHLPFTPEPHEGAFIFTFYLALGHVAHLTGTPPVLTFHVARVAAGLFFLLVAYQFVARFFADRSARMSAFMLLALSSGLGWLAGPFGYVTADLWVTEALTFPALLANPHFPLAIGLMLLLCSAALDTVAGEKTSLRTQLRTGCMGLALAVILPFAVPIVLAVLGSYAILSLWQRRAFYAHGRAAWNAVLPVVAAGLGAAPVIGYDILVYTTNPALEQWSRQNLTPSLPPWDYALGYGLVLILAVGGLLVALRRRSPTDLLLLGWVGAVAVLLYVPFPLQRRFITGFHVPLSLLATIGLVEFVWPRLHIRRRGWVTGGIIGFSALSNLFLIAVGLAGTAQGSYPLCATHGEAAALDWLAANTSPDDLVLAAPDTGLFIPAWAGNRVVYGHPFETIHAEVREEEAAQFFATDDVAFQRALLSHYGVRYVLVGPREQTLGGTVDPESLHLRAVFEASEVSLYGVEAAP